MPSYEKTSMHDGITSGNAWFTSVGKPTGNMVFDLGSVSNVDAFYLWNIGTGTESVETITLETSLLPSSGFSFTSLGSGALNAQPPGSISQTQAIPAVEFAFDPVSARYVRMTIVTNGGANNFTGLREVAFNESSAAVPEPSSFALIGLGVAGMLGYGWRRGKQKASA